MADDFNNLPQIIAALEAACKNTVVETAAEIVADAKTRAPVSTGAMQSSIHAVSEAGSGYDEARQAAVAARPEIAKTFGREAQINQAPGLHEAVVDVPVDYAEYVHNGTGRMAARPFLESAGLAKSREFQRRLRDKLKSL